MKKRTRLPGLPRAPSSLTNDGDATVVVSSIDWDDDSTASTVADDFDVLIDGESVLGNNPGISLAPGATKVLTVNYANNDASTEDIANLAVVHSGDGGLVGSHHCGIHRVKPWRLVRIQSFLGLIPATVFFNVAKKNIFQYYGKWGAGPKQPRRDGRPLTCSPN